MKTAIAKGLILLATITITLNANESRAQMGSYGQPTPQGFGGGIFQGYGVDYGYGPATAAESWYRGYADLVRAWGENNFNNSAAQINWEQAREKAIANHTASVEQFFALRKFNEEQRIGAIAKGRLSKEKLVAISKKSAPQRLDEANWNAATDGLAWPKALQTESFAVAGARLDVLIRLRRDSSSGLTADEQREAQQLVESMTSELKNTISQVKPSDYAAAKRFLTSVGHESKFDLASGERMAQR